MHFIARQDLALIEDALEGGRHQAVNLRFEHDGAVAIPLPHPSGASGWLNDPANRERVAEASALIRAELDALSRR